eukprot:m.136006 g.136006  ORF g.136006 m.136006 type:complete len:55 (+) comp38172_c1_seq57:244-408(+)
MKPVILEDIGQFCCTMGSSVRLNKLAQSIRRITVFLCYTNSICVFGKFGFDFNY